MPVPRGRLAPVAVALVSGLVCGFTGWFDVGVAGAQVPLPPVVEEVDPGTDTLVVSPPVTTVPLAAGDATTVEHAVVNGTGQALDLEVRTHAVAPGSDGAPAIDGEAGDAGAQVGLEEFDPRLHLEPDEQAVLTGVVTRPAGAPPGVAALTLTAGDGARITAFVLVTEPGAGTAPEVSVSGDFEDGHAILTIEAAGDSPAIVDAAARIRSWWLATVGTADIPSLLVWPDVPRTVRAEMSLPPVPGPYTLDIAATAGESAPTVRASTTSWRWPPGSGPAAAAAALIAVSLVLIVRAWRRRTGERSNGARS